MNTALNPKLVEHIKQRVFPIYETFDKGHDVNHITAVINRAFKLAQLFVNLDLNILYASAALHDIGISIQRENHAMLSGIIVITDKSLGLNDFFTDDEIEIIAEAVEDHSTSRGLTPRSIYGKIVCDADKDDDVDTSLLRAYEFTKSYYPNYTEEEVLDNVFKQLNKKFGEKGLVKFWINTEEQQEFLKTMNYLASDRRKFKKRINSLIST